MEVIAKARYIRMSPRKVRLVADLVRGLDVAKAEAQLRFVGKAAARPVLKVIRSARANAEHNHKLETGTLFIKSITVDGGPVLSRWRARAFGRAAPIRKRTSHITVILGEREIGSKGSAAAAVVKPASKAAKAAPKKKPSARPAGKKAASAKKTSSSSAKGKKK